MSYYKAVALDFDGTLTADGRVAPELLDRLRRARSDGLTLLLVTGRILDELRATFPQADDLFDAIVAENGAVLVIGDDVRDLAEPVSAGLYDALRERRIDARRGRVLLACHAADDRVILDEIKVLALEDQLVHNRGELMVLPPGVTKATGVRAALTALGLSPHNLVAVGDAENDHAMLAASQLAVAVHNAVPTLKAEADLVLTEPDGAGIVALLDGGAFRGDRALLPDRHRITVGARDDGSPLRLDVRQRVLVAGGTHSGKSFVGGLITERLIEAGYGVVVFDAEGDHVALDHLPDTITITGEAVLVDPASVTSPWGRRALNEIVDMSTLSAHQQQDLVDAVLPHVASRRRRSGMPHSVVLDEAHLFFGEGSDDAGLMTSDDGGCCLVTYAPAALPAAVLVRIDVAIVLAFGTADAGDPNLVALASVAGVDPAELGARLQALPSRRAVLLDRSRPGEIAELVTDRRGTPHVRHRHKYADQQVAAHLAFHFCAHDGDVSGPAVRSLDAFAREIRRCSPAMLQHHARRHDFSRWALDVLRDGVLADALRAGEATAIATPDQTERGRAALLEVIEARYLR